MKVILILCNYVTHVGKAENMMISYVPSVGYKTARHNKRLSHNHIKTNKMSNFLIETNNIWISGQFLCTLSAWVIAPWSLIRVLPIYRRRMDGGNDFTQIPEITEKLSQNFKLPLHNHRHRLLKKSDGKYLQRLITIIRHC